MLRFLNKNKMQSFLVLFSFNKKQSFISQRRLLFWMSKHLAELTKPTFRKHAEIYKCRNPLIPLHNLKQGETRILTITAVVTSNLTWHPSFHLRCFPLKCEHPVSLCYCCNLSSGVNVFVSELFLLPICQVSLSHCLFYSHMDTDTPPFLRNDKLCNFLIKKFKN